MENWLIKRARLTPNRVAVQEKGQQLTFQEVADQTKKIAERLTVVARTKPRIALIVTNTIASYLTIMAVQQLGKTIVFINRRLSVDEINYQLTDADISLLITDEDYQHQLNVYKQLTFSALSTEKSTRLDLVENFPDDAVTSIMYTSGTTGKPKGVMQTFNNHFFSAMGSALNLGLTADDAWLTAVPIFHISGFSILMRGLIYGMRVVLLPKFNAHQANELLVNSHITTMSVVPVMLKQLLNDLPENVSYNSGFRTMLLGGGPTDRATLKRAQAHHIPIIQSYGMTETASQVIALDAEYADEKLGSVGKPLFPVSLKIADHLGVPVKMGNIWIKSPTLTIGYLNQPNKLAEKCHDGWFNTEDFGYLDDDGFLFVQGREGDMISSGGENIFPDEIESVYLKLPKIDNIVVVGVPDEQWGQVPVAIVAGSELSLANLKTYGREKLAHYKVPKRFYFANDWHRTASGKTQRIKFIAEITRLKELT
ncbi:o-succinylbenzoate--CoA ligase [Leuconostoc pseudomesenteroides]|uniref:o-succinylbenzoate--CoA ligase n=1 Tax=Leuconostoc pseudomesenteroides TaxID=33968 RepID=UPI0039EBEF78